MINLTEIADDELDALCDSYYPERISCRKLIETRDSFKKESLKIESDINNLLSFLSDEILLESELSLDITSEICDDLKMRMGILNDCLSDALDIMDKSKAGATYRQIKPEYPEIPFSYDKDLASGVKIEIQDDITTIILPKLPPNKKSLSRFTQKLSDGKSYEIDTYYLAIANILKNMSYKRYNEKVVLFFKFVYCEKDRALTDHDNLALKSLIDLVAAFFLVDDSPDKCAHFYDYGMGEESSTIISVIPHRFFPCYLKKEVSD